jgi:hypothetical protein
MHLPVNEQSKAMIQTAIQNDTEFLSKSNIMDYSLLVGVDREKGEMTAGIVGMRFRMTIDIVKPVYSFLYI